MWILISLLFQKPADLNQHCFQKRVKVMERKNMFHFFLSKYITDTFSKLSLIYSMQFLSLRVSKKADVVSLRGCRGTSESSWFAYAIST